MLVVDLPATHPAKVIAPFAILGRPNLPPPLGFLGLGGSSLQTTSIALTTTLAPGIFETILPPNIDRVERLSWGNDFYTLAVNPRSLQPGEFFYNSRTGLVRVSVNKTLPAGSSFNLLCQKAPHPDVVADDFITDLALLPEIYRRFELKGSIAWGCSWEGQPSTTFTLICPFADVDAIVSELKPKLAPIEFYGIGFEVSSLDIAWDYLTEEAEIQVQMRGKWERYLEEQVLLDAAQPPQVIQQALDRYAPKQMAGKFVGTRVIRGNTTAQAIATLVGAKVLGPPMPIQAPTQANSEQIMSLADAFTGHLRPKRMFARYSDAEGIRAIALDSVPTHTIWLSDLLLEEENQLTLKTSIQYRPRAKDYKNARLEWGSSASRTSNFLDLTQGVAANNLPPYWKQKPPELKTLLTGSVDPTTPSSEIKLSLDGKKFDLSLLASNGGPTKEREIVTTYNGVPIFKEHWKYGFMALACDHLFDLATTTVGGAPALTWTPKSNVASAALWQLVEYTVTEYKFDNTRYLVRELTSGYRQGRLFEESDDYGSLTAYLNLNFYNTNNTPLATELLSKKLAGFRYQQIPIREEKIYTTDLFRGYFPDTPEQPKETYETLVPAFTADGKRQTFFFVGSSVTGETEVNGKPYLQVQHQVPVPGWTDPRFVFYEQSRKIAFATAPDPESTAEKPRPDRLAGEDTENETSRSILSSDSEVYIERVKTTTAKDAGLNRIASQTLTNYAQGRPSEHVKLEDRYEKIDPNKNQVEPSKYKYLLNTIDGFDPRIEGEPLNYPYARTFEEAMAGAETDLAINNSRDTETLSIKLRFTPGIKEGDKIWLEDFGYWRCLSYNHEHAIVAPGTVEAVSTALTLGKLIANPPISVRKILLPEASAGDYSVSTNVVVVNKTPERDSGGLVFGNSRGNR